MKIGYYARHVHNEKFTDFRFMGYVVAVVVGRTPEEEIQLGELERFTLPGDDYHGGEVERVGLMSIPECSEVSMEGRLNRDLSKGYGLLILGDERAGWYFDSMDSLEKALADDPPSIRD